MAQKLDLRGDVAGDRSAQDRQNARATARAFAAAAAALLVSTLVVARSDSALTAEGTGNSNRFEAGTIALADDDQGRQLFDLSNMAPGRPQSQCITVGYQGTILPVDISMKAEAQGELADHLQLSVEQGRGGAFGSCAGFEPDADLFEGSLAGLAASGWTPVARIRNDGTELSFRFTFDVADESDAVGASATASIVWEAVPA
jgi:hypothetical protein